MIEKIECQSQKGCSRKVKIRIQNDNNGTSTDNTNNNTTQNPKSNNKKKWTNKINWKNLQQCKSRHIKTSNTISTNQKQQQR